MSNPIKKVESPVGDLEWVIIDGEGKENLSGKLQYKADLVVDGEKADAFKAEIDQFWADNRPKLIKEPKSTGYYAHTVKTDEVDEETGKHIYEETGKTRFSFATGTTYQDGSTKIIKVFNAKGAEVSLAGQKIGNGSRGRMKGAMGIYTVENKGKLIDAGVTLYLDAIQLAKFVAYEGGPSFDEMEDEDADFDGVDSDGMGGLKETSSSEESSTTSPKPRL